MGSERVNVSLDGEFAFSLAAELGLPLREGQRLEAVAIQELLDRDQGERAYQQALHFLAARPRSAAEVRRRLTEYDYPPTAIDAALARLEHHQLVNDQQFAEYWVGQRQQFHPRGPRALRAELRRKGIDTETVDTAIEPVAEEQEEAAVQAGSRKAQSLHLLDERSFTQTMTQYLVRRGFDYDATRSAVRRLRASVTDSAETASK